MTIIDFTRGFGLAFFCFISASAQAGAGPIVQWYTDTYSEPEPVASTFSDWGDEFRSGERQWVLSEFTLGYRFENGIELSWQRRAQASTRINAQAAEFYGRVQREETLVEGEQTPLSLTVDSFAAHGARIGYHHQWQRLWITAGVSYLQTSHLIDGTLNGSFTALADNQYQVNAEIDYVYYTDPVFNRPDIDRATGQGIALDTQLFWQLNDHWALDFKGKDLFAVIEWDRAPLSIGEASTRRKQIGEDGYAEFNPLFSGRESYKDHHSQRITPRLQTELTRTWNRWQFNALWQRQFDVNHWGTGVGFEFQNGQQITLAAWPQREAMEISWRSARWAFSLHTDLRSWSNTHSLGLSLQYQPGP